MMRKHRFTLIELLLVVAVIIVLVGMLMPALRNAKISAKRIVCTNNLKQLGLALHEYNGDNSGYFPTIYNTALGWPDGWWYCALYSYCYPGKNGTPALTDFRNTAFDCPSYDSTSKYKSYGMNVYLSGSWKTSVPLKIAFSKLASQQACIMDSIITAYLPPDQVQFRHSNGTNVIFIDLHTETVPYRNFPLTLTTFWTGK